MQLKALRHREEKTGKRDLDFLPYPAFLCASESQWFNALLSP